MNKFVRVVLIVSACCAMLIAAAVLSVNFYVDQKLDTIEHEEIIEVEEAEIAPEVLEAVQQQKIVNIALFGADNDEEDPMGDQEDRSDAMKIVSLDYNNKKIKITSVERDLVVYIPGDYQKYGHFNWAYSFGGPELAVKTMNYNLDLDITQYVSFSFKALSKLVDLVGGVDLYLTSAEIRQQNKPLGVKGPEGVYTLDGYHATMYCRIRYIDSDFTRMERQNNVINAILAKVKDKSMFELLDIVEQMLPYITTNLTNQDIKNLLVDVLTFDLSNIEMYKEPVGEYDDICHCPGLGGYLVRSYSEMVKHFHFNIYGDENYLPSQTVIDNEKRTYQIYGNFSK